MSEVTPARIRSKVDELDRRIARVQLQVASVTSTAAELERAGVLDGGANEQLVGELWLMVDRLRRLRDSWAILYAALAGEAAPVDERERVH